MELNDTPEGEHPSPDAEALLQKLTIGVKENSAMAFAQWEAAKQQDTQSLEEKIPNRYHRFMKVFSAKAADRFPLSRACDHAINLKPGFVPKAGKRFPVTAEEEAETDKFIQENLDKGFIRPSKSPQTSSLF